MKALRLIYCLTVMGAVWAAPVLRAAAQEDGAIKLPQGRHDCSQVTDALLKAIEADPSRLNEFFKQAVLESKHCTCELLAAAISTSDGSEKAVKDIVSTALQNAGEMASAIAECAAIAAPTRMQAIREAFAERVEGVAGSEKKSPESGDKTMRPESSSSGLGRMIGKWMPGRKSKDEVKGEDRGEAAVVSLQMNEVTGTKDQGVDSHSAEAEAGTASSKETVELGVATEGEEVLEMSPDVLGVLNDAFVFDYVWPEISGVVSDFKQAEKSDQARWSAYADNGFDSNINTAPGGDARDSYFVGAGVASYFSRFTRNTRFDVRGRFGFRYNENTPVNLENLIYRGRLLATLQHELNDRVSLSNQTGITYDAEPDFLAGETTSFRTDQYVFAYNRLGFVYRWAEHFATRTYYNVSTIQYESGSLSLQEERWRHLIGQRFDYVWNEQQVAFLEYRYGQSNFQNVANDSQSHYFIGGLDYQLSTDAKASLAAGAERRSFERFSNLWRPYAQASFQSQWSQHTELRWRARLGLEDAELGDFRDRYSFRTGLSVDQQLSDRLKASVGFFYLRSEFDSGAEGVSGYTDDALMLQLGLSYALLPNTDLYLVYDFTTYDSGDPLRDYERQQVKIGLNSKF